MLTVNEYFGGKVKSIGFISGEGKATAGVMAPGEYEFGTSCKEIMKVTCGKLTVKLPGSNEWKDFPEGTSFIVEANLKFQLKVATDTSYICLYK
jgi:purine/pyrimidine-nucleoside phosphorylase